MGSHDPEWQSQWYNLLRQAFNLSETPFRVKLNGIVLHVHLEDNSGEHVTYDQTQSIALVKLGARAIQHLITSSSPKEADEPEEGKGTPIVSAPPKTNTEAAPDVACKEIKGEYQNPPSSRQDNATEITIPVLQNDSAEELARLFLRACQSYHLHIDECDPLRAVAGPTVWRFYLRLSRGQRLAELRSHLEDIGREMGRSGLLVNSVPPDVVLDVPRSTRQSVSLINVLDKIPGISSPEQLPIPIGITPEGTHLIRDLSTMPHLLVGGTTGSGKTIFLYGLLTSLLKTHPSPKDLRFILSTSKPEDFVFFDGLPHLEQGKIITDAIEAVQLLQTFVNQALDERGEILRSARCRDISEYNSRSMQLLAPLVVVVDEFADLADQLAGNRQAREAFYGAIRRIAQLGRSKGIHLILCTQRPSADLVPTSIRNLMNARVSLHVNDGIASKMILDETGAEQLQLRGDLLYKEYGTLTRAQGYYVSSAELDAILLAIRAGK